MFSNYFTPPNEEVMKIKEQSSTGTIGSSISVFGLDFIIDERSSQVLIGTPSI